MATRLQVSLIGLLLCQVSACAAELGIGNWDERLAPHAESTLFWAAVSGGVEDDSIWPQFQRIQPNSLVLESLRFEGWVAEHRWGRNPFLESDKESVDIIQLADWSSPRSWRATETLFSMRDDLFHYYSWETAQPFLIVTGVAALMANTNFDGSFDRHYESLRISSSNGFVETVKTFGDGAYMLPVYGGAMIMHWMLPDDSPLTPVGEWGERAMRAFVVGAPPMLIMQLATGGSRPEEGKSHWHPFTDNNGVSGHSFMGSLPFLTAAYMTENRPLRTTLFVASGLTAWSRINDRDHYLSQAVLGWTMGWLAVQAVADVEDNRYVQLIPVATPQFTGAFVSLNF